MVPQQSIRHAEALYDTNSEINRYTPHWKGHTSLDQFKLKEIRLKVKDTIKGLKLT